MWVENCRNSARNLCEGFSQKMQRPNRMERGRRLMKPAAKSREETPKVGCGSSATAGIHRFLDEFGVRMGCRRNRRRQESIR